MKTTLQKEAPKNGQQSPETEYVVPEVNIFETQDGYVLEAEMAGVNKENLEITVAGNEITIIGHRIKETQTGEPLFRERNTASFRRVFELDPAIDTGKINARMNQGVLTLTLPKSDEVKPRRVTVSD